MTVEKPKCRAWFQLHLSTCVVLMVVAGALVWANVEIRFEGETIGLNPAGQPQKNPARRACGVAEKHDQGWPFNFRTSYKAQGEHPYELHIDAKWGSGAFVMDICIAIAVLVLAAFLCEYLIRRRERMRQDPAP
ncbi:MAG: hypothetical protein L6R28_04275 [Planctomycetes bacterium]|nr:hypothetical protein [Planctomycetota bacterium]